MSNLYTLAAACGATNAYENSPKIGFDPEAWAKFEAALSAPAVETVAVQYRRDLDPNPVRALQSPLPVAPKAEPDTCIDDASFALAQTMGAQPVVADTLTDAEVLEYCDTHPEATFAQAVLALASPPRAIPAEQAAPTEPHLNPVAWRYRHTPAVGWSFSEHRHPRNDLTQEPLYTRPHEAADGSAEARKPLSNDQIADLIISWISIGGEYVDLVREVERLHGIAAMGTPAAAEPGKGEGNGD